MINKIIDKIIEIQSRNNYINNEEIEVYRYGYFLLISNIINFLIAITIGIIFNEVKLVICFLILYIPLRMFCGGWHADKIWKCTILSNVVIILLVFVNKCFFNYFTMVWMIVICLISMVTVQFIAPLDTVSKKITENERKNYKLKIKVIIVLHMMMLIVGVIYKKESVLYLLNVTYITQIFMLALEVANRTKNFND